jgi:hypothetical protein
LPALPAGRLRRLGGEDKEAPRLAFLSRGFHPEQRRETSTGLIIVCDICDEVQEDIIGGAVH